MIGFHMPAGADRGLVNIWKDMVKLKVKSVQIFSRNPRKVYSNTTNFSDINEFIHLIANKKLNIFTHASYGVMLHKNSPISVSSLHKEIKFLNKVGGKGVVIHIGSSKDNWCNVKDAVINNLLKVVARTTRIGRNASHRNKAKLLLENQVKCGNKILTSVCEMIELWKMIRSHPQLRTRVGFCYDTCHGFVTNKINNCPNTVHDDLKLLLREDVPIDVVHLNDSQSVTADRHANIFEGMIPRKSLINVMKLCRRKKIPMIIERSKEGMTVWQNMLIKIRKSYN